MALEYPYDDHPTPGTTLEVAPGVRWLTMPMGGSLNHINLYLLDDGDGWFVVDTGLPMTDVQALWREMFASELGGSGKGQMIGKRLKLGRRADGSPDVPDQRHEAEDHAGRHREQHEKRAPVVPDKAPNDLPELAMHGSHRLAHSSRV